MNPDEVVIDYGETLLRADESEISFLELIEESRCPSDAICGWPGLAKVKILWVTSTSEHEFELIKINGPTVEDTIIENMTIRLLDVSPYPISSQAIDSTEYSITLQIQ